MRSLTETLRKPSICVRLKDFTWGHQIRFVVFGNRSMDSNKRPDNGTRSYMTLLPQWGSNDLNLIVPFTSSFGMMSASSFLYSLTTSRLPHPIPLQLTPLSRNSHPTSNFVIWDLPPSS